MFGSLFGKKGSVPVAGQNFVAREVFDIREIPVPVRMTNENRDAIERTFFDETTGAGLERLDPQKVKNFLKTISPRDKYRNMAELTRPIQREGDRLVGLFTYGETMSPCCKFAVRQFPDGSFGGETATKVAALLVLSGPTVETTAALLFNPETGDIYPFGQSKLLSSFDFIQDRDSASAQFSKLESLVMECSSHAATINNGDPCVCDSHRAIMTLRLGKPAGPAVR